jgi:hypothetical protein
MARMVAPLGLSRRGSITTIPTRWLPDTTGHISILGPPDGAERVLLPNADS